MSVRATGLQSAPSLLITVPYEGRAKVAINADSLEAERALVLWLTETPALQRLADEVLDLHERLREAAV